jgi:hypothetical protein
MNAQTVIRPGQPWPDTKGVHIRTPSRPILEPPNGGPVVANRRTNILSLLPSFLHLLCFPWLRGSVVILPKH